MLLAAEEMIQENIGFSPDNLEFGHPVAVLVVMQNDWKSVCATATLRRYIYIYI